MFGDKAHSVVDKGFSVGGIIFEEIEACGFDKGVDFEIWVGEGAVPSDRGEDVCGGCELFLGFEDSCELDSDGGQGGFKGLRTGMELLESVLSNLLVKIVWEGRYGASILGDYGAEEGEREVVVAEYFAYIGLEGWDVAVVYGLLEKIA